MPNKKAKERKMSRKAKRLEIKKYKRTKKRLKKRKMKQIKDIEKCYDLLFEARKIFANLGTDSLVSLSKMEGWCVKTDKLLNLKIDCRCKVISGFRLICEDCLALTNSHK